MDRAILSVLKDGAVGGNAAQIEATLRSSCSIDGHLPSLSSGTSYGKEPIYENTIEQILGKIERSQLGDKRDLSYDSYDQSKNFRKQIEAKLFGSRRSLLMDNFANGSKQAGSGGISSALAKGLI